MTERVRVPNFMPSEKTHLLRIIAVKYSDILEDKKTDRSSIEKKANAWLQITSEFNASSSAGIQRTTASLKKCYDNRKKELRKVIANERREFSITGGGPPPKKFKCDESDEILLSIINKKTLYGLENQYDDDADESLIDMQNTEDEIEFIVEQSNQGKESFVNTTSDNEPQATTSTTMVDDSNELWRKGDGSKLKQPIDPALKCVCNTPKCKENKDPSTPNSHRRSRTVIKPLTSSDVAKKYDVLLDKRLQLINKQLQNIDEEHELIMKKRHLEIKILEAELQKTQNSNS